MAFPPHESHPCDKGGKGRRKGRGPRREPPQDTQPRPKGKSQGLRLSGTFPGFSLAACPPICRVRRPRPGLEVTAGPPRPPPAASPRTPGRALAGSGWRRRGRELPGTVAMVTAGDKEPAAPAMRAAGVAPASRRPPRRPRGPAAAKPWPPGGLGPVSRPLGLSFLIWTTGSGPSCSSKLSLGLAVLFFPFASSSLGGINQSGRSSQWGPGEGVLSSAGRGWGQTPPSIIRGDRAGRGEGRVTWHLLRPRAAPPSVGSGCGEPWGDPRDPLSSPGPASASATSQGSHRTRPYSPGGRGPRHSTSGTLVPSWWVGQALPGSPAPS